MNVQWLVRARRYEGTGSEDPVVADGAGSCWSDVQALPR